jgi:hypothetical protein
VLATIVSGSQFSLYDCSGLPALSFGAGVLTVALALILIDRMYLVGVSARALNARIAIVAAIAIVGGAVVVALGWLTVMTHICG